MTDRSVVYRLRAEIGQFRTQMAVAGASVKDVGQKMTAANKDGDKFRKGLDTFGSAAGKAGLVAAAGLGVAIAKAADFDQSMSNVAAATHETTQNMQLLRAAALKAGADTAFSATEAAGGIEALAKAGVATKDVLDGGLAGALDLAAAGSLDVSAAAEAAATAMTQFGLSGTDVPHIADLLAAAAGKAQGEVSDMNFALAQSGLVANQMGLSIEETTGGLAAFASAGLLGSDAGTSFKATLAALTPNSKKARDEMQRLGINAFDAQGNFIGLAEFSGQLKTQLAGLSDQQRQTALETIFGSDAVRAASVLYEEGEQGIRDWTAAVDDQGFAAETAATKLDNLKGDLEAFSGSLETALIGTGDGAQGPLRKLVQQLTGAVNAYNDLGEGAKSGVGKVLVATAAIGGGIFVFSKVVRAVSATKLALQDLGVQAGSTSGSLGRLARTSTGLLVLAGAVTAVGNAIGEASGAKLDTADLQRDLDALQGGRGELLDRTIEDLKIVNQLSGDLTEPVKEVVTLFGLFGNTNLDNAKDNLSQVDGALASMVESGNGAEAASIFERIMAASDLDDAEVTEFFDSYQTALGNASAAVESLPSTAPWLSDWENTTTKVRQGARVFTYTAEEIKAMEDALKEATDQARATGGTFFGLGEKVDKAKVSLSEWIDDLERQAKALENFTKNAETAADKGLKRGLIQALEEAGPAGALRLKQLANASDKEIDRANRAWARGQKAIDNYVKATVKVPKPLRVDVDSDQALSKIEQLERKLSNLKGFDVNIRATDTGFGPGFAGGGFTGHGGKYDPAGVVHRGEFVFSKEATQGNLGMLNTLHHQLRGYASGGYVSGGASIDYDRLAMALAANNRPVYGDVTVYGPASDWEARARTQARSKARAGH